jgi:hypothetical protein
MPESLELIEIPLYFLSRNALNLLALDGDHHHLHIALADLLLHRLLEAGKRQLLAVLQAHLLVVLLVQQRLNTLLSSPDSLGLVLDHGA